MVTVLGEKEETREIRSNIDNTTKTTAASRAKAAKNAVQATAEDIGDRKFENHLNGYYDGVISMLRSADAIWIFGPGIAKTELKKRLDEQNLGMRIDSVETVDKMTDSQIVAKVRLHYDW